MRQVNHQTSIRRCFEKYKAHVILLLGNRLLLNNKKEKLSMGLIIKFKVFYFC